MGKRTKAELAEWAVLALALFGLGIWTALHLRADHERLETRERLRLTDQTKLIEDNLARQLEAVNNALAGLQADLPAFLGRRGGSLLLAERLRSMAGVMPGVRTFFVLDAGGSCIASNRPGLIGQDLSGRAYFTLARQSNDPAILHVSSPIRNALGTYSINLERSTRKPDGAFTGLIAATLDPEYFSTLLNSVNYASDMWTSLVHGDGTLFLMVPEPLIPPGSQLHRPGALFTRHLESGQAVTVMNGRVLTTGEQRMVARRTVRPAFLPMDAPLVVAVTRRLDVLFARWWTDVWFEAGLYALVVVVGCGGLFARHRRQRSLAEAEALQEVLRRDGERRMSLFFDRQIVGMAITSPDRGWVKVNDRLCQMLGYPREELYQTTWAALTHPDDLPRDQVRFDELAAGAIEGYSSEKRYVRKDGSILYAELSVGCVRHLDGGLDCVLALVADITERRRVEREAALRREELEQLNRSLEARIQEGVALLRAKDQVLIVQGRQAALGEMLGNIAHQWRQPLNALSMVLVNLRDAQRHGDLQPEGFEGALDKAGALIQRMSTTINDFRDFFRPGRAKASFSVLEQVQAAVALVEVAFQARGITIRVEAAEDLRLFGLPNELSQVLVNLLMNSRQAIQDVGRPEGWISIRIEAVDGSARIQVADNGGGVPEAHLDRIFEPYFSTRETGTGIGLYMSRQIIEQSLRGRILARNAGDGAEFTLLIPLEGARP